MSAPFTNAHAHIFTSNHAPDYFLETVIGNDTLARWAKKLLQKDGTRWAIKGVLKFVGLFSAKKKQIINRYLEFIKIGTSVNQAKIFENISRSYAQFPGHRIIVLTQVLDYLDLQDTKSQHIRIRSQVEEVANIKKNALYQNHINPFLGVDPRQTGFNLLTDWVQKYLSPDEGFCGIKIYPAAGFFPFDKRMYPIYKWAEENDVPIMTHATRSGSFYLGSFESILNTGILALTDLDPQNVTHARILERVKLLVAEKSIHKKNEIWCNIFGHPDNYEVVLKDFPKLKICLAHLGGADEVIRSEEDKLSSTKKKSKFPTFLQDNWYTQILELMKKHPNVYSDISYTLSDDIAMKIIVDYFTTNPVDQFEVPLIQKLMYGTDFYLTQVEVKGDEINLQQSFLKCFTDPQMAKIVAYDSPNKYLVSKIFPPDPPQEAPAAKASIPGGDTNP